MARRQAGRGLSRRGSRGVFIRNGASPRGGAELLQLGPASAGVERGFGGADAADERRGEAGAVDGGAGVEDDRGTRRAPQPATENALHPLGVVTAVAPPQAVGGEALPAELGDGVEGAAFPPAVRDLEHLGGAERGDLVEPRLAM